ncbi:hypothetical protein NC652_021026 [Populus alba x Populus x berolinensis]|nr:hypothetical protein NC652_021026 [Populus alba x Populus x berolinensis]
MCQHISTVYRRIKEDALRPHSNAMKPHLTEANKKASDFTCHERPHKDIISSLMELSLLRAGKGKSFITKIMFLAAVARH